MRLEISEKEVEDIIFEKQLLEQYDIKCVFRQKKLGVAGIADIIGWDRENKAWVIIEIKKGTIDTKAYAQAKRYQRWLTGYLKKKTLAQDRNWTKLVNRKPYVLLIGDSMSDELRFIKPLNDDEGYRTSEMDYYTVFKVEPRLNIHWSSTSQLEYNEKFYEEMDDNFATLEERRAFLVAARKEIENGTEATDE